MRVVIAIDESKYSQAVLETVAGRQWCSGASFMVLNVLAATSPEHIEDIGLGLDKETTAKLRAKQIKLLGESVSYLKEHLGPDATVHMASAEGHAAENIVKVATDWEADLIILGSHGYTGFTKFVLGSVAEAVLLNAELVNDFETNSY
jgi:nucleotide-binding universal stress UspA family protein